MLVKAIPSVAGRLLTLAVKVALVNSLHGFGNLIKLAQPTTSEVAPCAPISLR